MPRRRKKATEEPTQQPAVNGPATGEVLTLAEAAALLRVPEQAVATAVTWQGLSGRMIGGEWRFTKGAILRWLALRKPTADVMRMAAGGHEG
jgi:hypothetical protein